MENNHNDYEIINRSSDSNWIVFKAKGRFGFVDNSNSKPKLVYTPGGKVLDTSYLDLAERILKDLQKYGLQNMSGESVLPWHYTMIDNFAPMEHKKIESILDDCFMRKNDWTYDIEDDRWKNLFGEKTTRIAEIKEWLSKCTHMQMTAACCIGNAYHSINIAYVLARLMENYEGSGLQTQFNKLAKLMVDFSLYGPSNEITEVFDTFNLYYGIHLKEEGPIINKPPFGFSATEGSRSLGVDKYAKKAESIIADMGMSVPDLESIFDTNALCDAIISYCKEHYKSDPQKVKEEFVVSSYYSALCLMIHHLKDKNAIPRKNAFQFLESQCDPEYCDIYSERLLELDENDADSKKIWELFKPYFIETVGVLKAYNNPSHDLLFSIVKPALAVGVAVAERFYSESSDYDSDYIGEELNSASLIGRNYYHYTKGLKDPSQPFVLNNSFLKLDIDNDEDNTVETVHNFYEASLSAYIPPDCWIKKINISEDNYEANKLLIITLDKNSKISSVSEVLEEVQRAGGGHFFLMGVEMPAKRHYSNQYYLSDEADIELEKLLKKRFIPQDFSLIGKKLPESILEESATGSDYSFTLQSAYRQAYMYMSIRTDDDGIIDDFDYITYQSTGSGYWDMFSRPHSISDKHEEAIDMVLSLVDKYSDDEWDRIKRST